MRGLGESPSIPNDLLYEAPRAISPRRRLAWEDIADEETDLRLDDGQKRQLAESLKKAQRDIKETVWRTYKNVMLLGKDGEWKTVDLGLVHSSAAPSIGQLIIERLGQAGDIEDKGVSPNFLVRNWPPAFKEWSTKSVRDAFFASPQFPRLLNPDSIKDTIARGVENGMLGYVGKKADGSYAPFHWNSSLSSQDVEISDDVFLIQRELAEAYKAGKISPTTGRLYVGTYGNWQPPVRLAPLQQPMASAPHTGKHSSPRVEWRRPAPKVDELLHEGAFEVRRNRRLEAHASSGGRPRGRSLAAEGR